MKRQPPRIVARSTRMMALGLAATALVSHAAEPWQAEHAEALVREAPFVQRALAEAPQPLRLAQGSQEALFGDAAPAEAESGPRVTGFLETTLAYAYGEPSHWSRAVARLQLGAQGRFGDDVRWKVSGRLDADPVYFGSDFYLDRVKDDQRADFFFRENYVDFAHGDWDFRLGAQQIVWGEVVGLFFADVVSARDMRDFLLPGFDVIRIPQWAARAEYTTGDHHLELVRIPVPAFDRIGQPGADFYPAPLPSPTPEALAEVFRNPERPARSLRNSNFGIRANTLLSGWDLSAFYYRSFSSQATFYREPVAGSDVPFVFVPRHDRIWQAGGTVSKDFGDFVLRAEAVYTHGQGFSVADLAQADSVVKRSTFDYIAGLEWMLPRDTRLNVQVFQRFMSGREDDLSVRFRDVGMSLYVSSKLTSTLEPQLLWIQYFDDAGAMIRPRLNWTVSPNTVVAFGADIFTGPANGFFGRFNNRDRVYVEARYSF